MGAEPRQATPPRSVEAGFRYTGNGARAAARPSHRGQSPIRDQGSLTRGAMLAGRDACGQARAAYHPVESMPGIPRGGEEFT
jgi:hypothetical protein